MIIRGLKTMALRVETQNSTALRMARLLKNHTKIEHVYYPGLKKTPWHHIAKSQMTGFGGVISFEVATDLQRYPSSRPRLAGVRASCSSRR